MNDKNTEKGQPVLSQAALFGLCPRCGNRTLYEGALKFAPKCGDCELDYSGFNVGDGPAAFLILIIGALITAMALTFEVKVHPPFWIHVLLWVPITLAAVVASLRVSKAALLYLEYRNQAGEGQLDDDKGGAP